MTNPAPANPNPLPLRCPAQQWILWGIPVLIAVGFPMHYLYAWSGCSPLVGAFAPVNESVWEHLKLTFWPMLLWWFAGYWVLQQSECFSAPNWLAGAATAQLVCPLVVVSFYYTYTGALGVESIVLDILALVLGVALAQLAALLVYKRLVCLKACVIVSFAVLIVLAILFTVFTFAHPDVPLFQSIPAKK